MRIQRSTRVICRSRVTVHVHRVSRHDDEFVYFVYFVSDARSPLRSETVRRSTGRPRDGLGTSFGTRFASPFQIPTRKSTDKTSRTRSVPASDLDPVQVRDYVALPVVTLWRGRSANILISSRAPTRPSFAVCVVG